MRVGPVQTVYASYMHWLIRHGTSLSLTHHSIPFAYVQAIAIIYIIKYPSGGRVDERSQQAC